MKVIYKYLMPFAEQWSPQLPQGAEIIRIDSVDGNLYMWAKVDTEQPLVQRNFHLFKTGGEIPSHLNLRYLGCGAIFIQMELMLYVFEELPIIKTASAKHAESTALCAKVITDKIKDELNSRSLFDGIDDEETKQDILVCIESIVYAELMK